MWRATRLVPPILGLLLVGGAGLAPPARADVTMSVSPSLVEIQATPGGTGSQQILVSNDGNEPFEVTATAEPYKQSAGDISAVDWLRVDPARFELQPGGSQVVTVSIVVPNAVRSGGRYAMVAFKTGAARVAGSNTAVAGQLGVPFLIGVDGAGALTREATLGQLTPVLEPDGRLGFRATLTNRGNLHVSSRGGAVEIMRSDGAPVGRLELPRTTAILPGGEELIATTGSLPMEDGGGFRAQATLDVGSGTPIGAEARFTARAALTLEDVGGRENFDRGPTLRARLHNPGSLGVLPLVQLAVRDANGAVLGTTEALRPPPIWPGQTAEIEAQLPRRLPTGAYTVVGRVEYGTAAPLERQAAFQIGSPPPPANPGWGEAPAPTRDVMIPAASSWWPALGSGLASLAFLAAAVGWFVYRRSSRVTSSKPIIVPTGSAAPAAPRYRLLLVGQPDADRGSLVELLERGGCAVAQRSTVEGVNELMRRGRPDAVILDTALDGRTVMQVYGALRAGPAGATMPIVFLDATAGDTVRIEGDDVYLGAGTAPAEVLRVVEDRLDKLGAAWSDAGAASSHTTLASGASTDRT